jgi:hypothetical protein
MRRIAIVAATIAAIAGGGAAFAETTPDAPAPARDPYLGAWALVVDGEFAAPVASVDGCGIAADVAQGRDGSKNVAATYAEQCTFEIGTNMSPRFVQWLNDSLASTAPLGTRMQIIRTDSRANAFELDGALLRSFSVPKLDAGGVNPAYLTLSIAADSIRYVPATAKPRVSRPTPITAPALQVGNQRMDLSSVGPWTAALEPRVDNGVDRDYPVTASGRAHFSLLPLRVPEATAVATMDPWLQAFLVQGKNGQEYEQSAILSLGPLQLALDRVGPARGDLAPRADNARTYSLYIERAAIVR